MQAAGYPSSYSRLVAEAKAEAMLTVYSSTDKRRMAPLLRDFAAQYPGIALDYVDLSAQEIYQRVIAEGESGRATGDLAWSSAMDLQIKLVNDGYSQKYKSPEQGALPPWAVWNDEAFGVTAEPIVFAYNRAAFAGRAVPSDHAVLAGLIERDRPFFRDRIVTYDPENSASGYLYLRQDQQANADTWQMIRAMGTVGLHISSSTDQMLSEIAEGRRVFGYNIIGSYALERQQNDPAIGVIIPRDYTLIMSRIALITADAPHPAAARLFLDFLLSKRGQSLLARAWMTPVRTDGTVPAALRLDRVQTRAIRVGPALLVNLDTLSRRQFFVKWHESIKPEGPGATPRPH